jgi:hypothetical protein
MIPYERGAWFRLLFSRRCAPYRRSLPMGLLMIETVGNPGIPTGSVVRVAASKSL